MARHAQEAGHEKLSYILRMAGSEALIRKAVFAGIEKDIGAWDWNIEKNLGFLDPVAAAMFGFDPVEASFGFPAATYYAAIHPDDLPAMLGQFSEAMRRGGPFAFDFRIVKAAQVRPIRLTGHAVVGDVGQLVRVAGLIYDRSHDLSDAEAAQI